MSDIASDSAEILSSPAQSDTPAHDAPQEEHDRYWLEKVHKPNEPQLTVRALIAGSALGGVMSVSNLYIGMKVGWSLGMALTSTILAFAMFKGLQVLRISTRELSSLENNTVASAASAAGYFASAGMVSAIPALYLTTQRVLEWYELGAWMLGVSFVGIFMAIPMRRQMIDVDRLPFPSGIACAETIRSMHTSAGEAMQKARALLWAAVIAALVELPSQFGSITTMVAHKVKVIWASPFVVTGHLQLQGLLFGKSLLSYTLALPTSPVLYGAGALVGLRVGLSLGLGALVLYGGLAPWLASHGIVVISENPSLTYRSVLQWAVWPGVMAALAASLTSLALKWRTIASAFTSLGRLAKRGTTGGMSSVEVPSSWFVWGMAGSTAYISVCAYVFFDIPVWMSVLAVVMSFFLSVVACRATGETDVTPIGALGKITQLTFAGLRPGHYATNLMTASITAGAAAHSADLLTDLKTGYILGGSPKRQFIAQLVGVLGGALFCVPAYMLVVNPEKIGSAELPAPAAQTWAIVAELLKRGVSEVDRGDAVAEPTTLQVVNITRRPAGTMPGDSLVIEEGPNAGTYRIESLLRGGLVLDRDLPVATVAGREEPLRAEVRGRGATEVKPASLSKPAVHFTRVAAGTAVGDFLRFDDHGNEVFHRIEAMRGDVASLDHAFASSQGETVQVQKRTLPPYALWATLIAVFMGILFALAEGFAPPRVKRWMPSISGMGISWVIAGYDSLAMTVGALVSWAVGAIAKDKSEKFTSAVAAGVIAGASLLGLLIIILRDVLHVVGAPK